MAASTKQKSRGRRRKPAAGAPATTSEPIAEASSQVRQEAQPYDEPAPPPTVPIEKPGSPAVALEERDTCGLPDEATPRASDLH